MNRAAKDIISKLGKPQKNSFYSCPATKRGGGVRAWPLKKLKKYSFFLNFFKFCSQSQIKHILFKGFFIWGGGDIFGCRDTN